MSNVKVQSNFRESLNTFDSTTPREERVDVHQQRETKTFICSAFFDLKTRRLILNDDQERMMSGDAKPPARRFNQQHPSEKSPDQLLRDLNEKLQLNAARRERFLESIVSKSRRFIEKVQKVRERLSRRQRETCQKTMNTLYNKRQAADRMRERLQQYKMDRIRKRLEHVMVVRSKKMTYLKEHRSTGFDDSTTPQPIETEV